MKKISVLIAVCFIFSYGACYAHDVIEKYNRFIEKNPDNFVAYYQLAQEYEGIKEYEQAVSCLRKATEINPNSMVAFYRLGELLYKRLGRMQEAIEPLKRAFWLSTKDAVVLDYLTLSHLTLGNFEQATMLKTLYLDLMEAKERRHHIDNCWLGQQDINGKKFCMLDYNGRGDVFMFIRHAKELKERGAYVIAMVRKEMIPIVSRCPYIDEFVPNGSELPDEALKSTYMRLPFLLYKNKEEFLAERNDVPYIYPDPVLVKHWEDKLAEDKNIKVGLCWDTCRYYSAKTGELIENNRPIPLASFYPLSRLKGISLYCLERYNGLDQLKNIPEDFVINADYVSDKSFDTEHGAYMDTAALMHNLDLVITIDTSLAHLAGAMGIKTWLLLPRVPDWRWFEDDTTTPWYPTMRIFKQEQPDDWDVVVKRIFLELAKK